MAAKKGIRKKVLEWLALNPNVKLTGRDLERMYVSHGGSVFPADYKNKSIRGRVDQCTMKGFIGSLPLKRVIDGPVCSSWYKQYFEKATFEVIVPSSTTQNYQPFAGLHQP